MVPGEGKTVRREVASILKAVVPNLVSLAFTTDLWTSLRFLHQPDAHIHHKDWLLHNWVPFVRLVGFGSLSEKERDYVGKIPKGGGGGGRGSDPNPLLDVYLPNYFWHAKMILRC